MLPFLIDVTHDYHLFKDRLDKVLSFKETKFFADLTKTEKKLVDDQVKALEKLIAILSERINLY